MDKQLIEKYSVIIAEFMGATKCKNFWNEDAYEHPDWLHQKWSNQIQDYFETSALKVSELNYHTDWNEIHKVWYKLWSSGLGTIEKIEYFTKKRKFIEKALVLLPEPYDVFILIGETIEYLNTIK